MFQNKKLIVVSVSALLLAACSDDDPVNISDVTFADSQIKSCIDKLVEDNTYQYTYEITSLSCPATAETPVLKLDGIESLSELTSLQLTYNGVTSLLPLSDLTSLKSVNLAKSLSLDCQQAKDQLAISRFSTLSLSGFCHTPIASVEDDFSQQLKLVLSGDLELAKQAEEQVVLQSRLDSDQDETLQQGELAWPLDKTNDGIGFIANVSSKVANLTGLAKPIFETQFSQLMPNESAQLDFIFDAALAGEQVPELAISYQYVFLQNSHQFTGNIAVLGASYGFSLYKDAQREEKQVEHLDIDLTFKAQLVKPTQDAVLPRFVWRVSGPGSRDTVLNEGQINLNTVTASFAQIYDMSDLTAQ
ncbi:hypothetical protein PULV_a2629 [Pseudoalteromonas ulvae UL12]|uniref:hypothetical protein n=1 Tax=Pseudoalteromonas ulvae TaxID=107327 RepID=UPI00186B8DC5|nr:hypothetical protein [Pseudoalteromonas ulvae]MBE0364323.1 hypothetical protein [Pseudoalteromonas ulvae UL12]